MGQKKKGKKSKPKPNCIMDVFYKKRSVRCHLPIIGRIRSGTILRFPRLYPPPPFIIVKTVIQSYPPRCRRRVLIWRRDNAVPLDVVCFKKKCCILFSYSNAIYLTRKANAMFIILHILKKTIVEK